MRKLSMDLFGKMTKEEIAYLDALPKVKRWRVKGDRENNIYVLQDQGVCRRDWLRVENEGYDGYAYELLGNFGDKWFCPILGGHSTFKVEICDERSHLFGELELEPIL